MLDSIEQERLLSHAISPESVEIICQKVSARIKEQGDKLYVSVADQLKMLDDLTQFDFGCYLLQNQGVNGYWTHYMVMHPYFGRKSGKNNRGHSFTALEDFMLNRMPIMLATQQRSDLFLEENQKSVKNGARLACIPSGMMGELLYLDFQNVDTIALVGIDYDAHTLKDAALLAEQKGLLPWLELIQEDAWHLTAQDEFDLISSNGLGIYEPDDHKVTELYRQFYKALKPGGKLVTSFLTFPPTQADQCEWDMSQINKDDLLRQKIVMIDIINVNCQYCRSSEQTKAQLESVGYKEIQFIYDKAKIFPTVVAYKK